MSWLLNRNILLKLGAAAVLLAVFMTVNQAYRISLRDSQFFNGWVLVAVMAGMLLLTFRKQLSTLPLGRVRHWLQVHYYLGFLAIGVFLVHTHLRFPNAPLEWRGGRRKLRMARGRWEGGRRRHCCGQTLERGGRGGVPAGY